MTLKEFIAQNRDEIDEAILQNGGNNQYLKPGQAGDAERRLWILNDESLYGWARREGVRI